MTSDSRHDSFRIMPASAGTKRLERVLAAADLAREPLAASTPRQRANWLRAVADALETGRGELVELAMRETHLPAARLDGELTRTAFQLLLLAERVDRGDYLDVRIDHADPAWPMGARPDIRRMNVPLGVVLVFAASNFPFAFSVAGGDTVPGRSRAAGRSRRKAGRRAG